MRKLLSTLIIIVYSACLMAQAPFEFQYQTVIRDNSGAIMATQPVSFQISIHQGSATGTVVYTETHQTTTNEFGLATLAVGGGTVVSGSMAAIDWAIDDYFIEIEVDPAGGASYVSVSTTQLLSVPYALNTRKATDMQLNDLGDVGGNPANGEVLKWNGSSWVPNSDDNTDNQTLSLSNNDLSISGGNTVILPGGITGVVAGTGLSGGGTSGSVILNAQHNTAMWNADQLQGSKISTKAPANGEVLKWNGSLWEPATDSLGSNAVWNINGSSAYYNMGHVGVGTAGPAANLQIDADSGENPLRVRVDGETKLMVHKNGGTGIGYSTSVPPENGLIVQGDIGIGTANPTFAKMHFHTNGFQDAIRITNPYTGTSQLDGAKIDLQTVNLAIINNESGDFTMGTNGRIHIRMLPPGNTAFNDVAASATVHIKQLGNGEEALDLENDGDTDTWSWEIGANDLNFYFNGSQVGYWDDATGSYTALSDVRLKKDIEYMDGQYLPQLLQLHPAMYRLTHADPESQKAIGFIAQEVQQVLPEAVRETEDGYLSINYADFGVLAVKAIQEQQKEIEKLSAQVEALRKLVESR